MSYCVHCGVELDGTAAVCPLCRTPVCNPNQPVDRESSKPFPTERSEVSPASKWELAVLISAMLGSVAVCCGLLNLFLRASHVWSLYVIGAAVMLWVFLVPPLLCRKLPLSVVVLEDTVAVGLYLLLIALELNGLQWYLHLALPIITLMGLLLQFLVFTLREHRRSILSTISLVIGSAGIFTLGLEFLGDLYFHGVWQPSWSLVVLIVAGALEIPLVVVRRIPALRDTVRKRFHM